MEYRSNLNPQNNLFKGVPADKKQNFTLTFTYKNAEELFKRMYLRFGEKVQCAVIIYKLDGTIEVLSQIGIGYGISRHSDINEFKPIEDIIKREEVPYAIFYEEKANCFQVVSA